MGIKKNVDNFVNRTIVLWTLGRLPFILLHRIPTPMDVLSMQSKGTRVITLFLTERELAKSHTANLYYMRGNPLHSREPLEFLIHDMTHMQHFMDPNIHLEQVTIFQAFTELYFVLSYMICLFCSLVFSKSFLVFPSSFHQKSVACEKYSSKCFSLIYSYGMRSSILYLT